MSTSESSRPLKRVLGSWDGAAIAIGIVIGTGIFRTPGSVANETGSIGLALSAWALGGLLAFIDALIIAELASLYPRAGGNYVYLKNAFGPFPAFMNGWLSTLVTYPASLAAFSVFFSECVARLAGRAAEPIMPLAFGLLILLAAVNSLGVRYGKATQNVFAAVKLLLLCAVVLLAFALPAGEAPEIDASRVRPQGLGIVAALGAALLGVMWTYDGYADVAVMGGEMREPGRSIPRALMGSMIAIAAIYLLANVAVFWVLPFETAAHSTLPLSEAARTILGPAGDTAVTIVAMVSVFGALNGVLLSGPRITYAIARDGLIFRWLSYVSRGQTPLAALALQVAMAMILTVPTKRGSAFEVLTGTSIFVIWLITFFASLSLLVFRIRYPDAPRPFRLPLYPYTFILHLLVASGFVVNSLWHEFETVKMGVYILILGVPVYFVWRLAGPSLEGSRRESPEESSARLEEPAL